MQPTLCLSCMSLRVDNRDEDLPLILMHCPKLGFSPHMLIFKSNHLYWQAVTNDSHLRVLWRFWADAHRCDVHTRVAAALYHFCQQVSPSGTGSLITEESSFKAFPVIRPPANLCLRRNSFTQAFLLLSDCSHNHAS